MTSPYLRRPLRSYAEAAAELRAQRSGADEPPADRPQAQEERPPQAAAPVEAGDD